MKSVKHHFTWYARDENGNEIQLIVPLNDKPPMTNSVCLFSPDAAKRMLGRSTNPYEAVELFLGAPLGHLPQRVRAECSIETSLPSGIRSLIVSALERERRKCPPFLPYERAELEGWMLSEWKRMTT